MTRLRPHLDHGLLKLDNNTAKRAMRSVALGRKNDLSVGSQTGGKSAAIADTLIETAKLNGVDPQAWLADTLARIPGHFPQQINETEALHEIGGSLTKFVETNTLLRFGKVRSANGDPRFSCAALVGGPEVATRGCA